MAIQILPEKRSIGDLLGTGLGSGISQGLQQLASQKASEMANRRQIAQTMQGLQSLGIPQQEASQVAMLPQNLQIEVVKNYLRGAEGAGISEALGSLGVPSGESMGQQKAEMIGEGIQEQPTFQEALTKPRLAPKQKIDIAKLEQKERFQQEKQKTLLFKETKADRKEILDKAKADKENLMRVQRMSSLNESDKLTHPAIYSLLKKAGLDFPVLLTPQSQEFKKLTIDFLKDAKKIFGARVTNFEAEKFLESIPSLSQTKEGRRRVIRNLTLLYKGSEVKSNAMKEVIRENNGVPPLDLLERIDEKTEPFMDEIASQFKLGIEGDEPSTEAVIGAKLSSLPKPNTLPAGTEITNKKTGKVYRSDGVKWTGI